MNQAITALVPVKLADHVSEEEFLNASETFQNTFVVNQPGILRREVVRTADREYMDIILFKSKQDADDVVAAEAESPCCQALFSLLDFSELEGGINFYASLSVYAK